MFEPVKLGPFFTFERQAYTYGVSLAFGLAALFALLPDSLFLKEIPLQLADAIIAWWPKLARDGAVIAKANPARAIQLILLMPICAAIGVIVLILDSLQMFRLGLEKPWPYYVRRANIVVAPAVSVFFAWFAYFGMSVAQFGPTIRSGRGIFYTDVVLFLYAGMAIMSFVGIIRVVIVYRLLLPSTT